MRSTYTHTKPYDQGTLADYYAAPHTSPNRPTRLEVILHTATLHTDDEPAERSVSVSVTHRGNVAQTSVATGVQRRWKDGVQLSGVKDGDSIRFALLDAAQSDALLGSCVVTYATVIDAPVRRTLALHGKPVGSISFSFCRPALSRSSSSSSESDASARADSVVVAHNGHPLSLRIINADLHHIIGDEFFTPLNAQVQIALLRASKQRIESPYQWRTEIVNDASVVPAWNAQFVLSGVREHDEVVFDVVNVAQDTTAPIVLGRARMTVGADTVSDDSRVSTLPLKAPQGQECGALRLTARWAVSDSGGAMRAETAASFAQPNRAREPLPPPAPVHAVPGSGSALHNAPISQLLGSRLIHSAERQRVACLRIGKAWRTYRRAIEKPTMQLPNPIFVPGGGTAWTWPLAVDTMPRAYHAHVRTVSSRLGPTRQDDDRAGEAVERTTEYLHTAARVSWRARLDFMVPRFCGEIEEKLLYVQEVGCFAEAAKAAALLVAHFVFRDIEHKQPQSWIPTGVKHHGTHLTELKEVCKGQDWEWPFVCPRFRGDRVFLLDSLVVTWVRGERGVSSEVAKKMYKLDCDAFQVVAEAIVACAERGLCDITAFSVPCAACVDYVGQRFFVEPLAHGITAASPAPLTVLGLKRTCDVAALHQRAEWTPVAAEYEYYRRQHSEVNVAIKRWEDANTTTARTLQTVAMVMRLSTYPAVLDPPSVEVGDPAAVLLINERLTWRRAAEMLPCDVVMGSRVPVEYTKRARPELLPALALPPTYATNAFAGSTWADIHFLGHDALTTQRERSMERLISTWTAHPLHVPEDVGREMHRYGVNIRMLGTLQRASTHLPWTRDRLGVEALMRHAKRVWRRGLDAMLRHPVCPVDFVKVTEKSACSLLNAVFGREDAFWNECRAGAVRYYTNVDIPSREHIRSAGKGLWALTRLCALLGFRLHTCAVTHRIVSRLFSVVDVVLCDDMTHFRSRRAQMLLPRAPAVRKAVLSLYGRLPPPVYTERYDYIRGFYPRATVGYARMHVATPSTLHAQSRHLLLSVNHLRLSIACAGGDHPDQTAHILNELALHTASEPGHDKEATDIAHAALYYATSTYTMDYLSARLQVLLCTDNSFDENRVDAVRRGVVRVVGARDVRVFEVDYRVAQKWPTSERWTQIHTDAQRLFGPAAVTIDAIGQLGLLQRKDGNVIDAVKSFQSATVLSASISDPYRLSEHLLHLAQMTLQKGALDDAVHFSQRCVSLCIQIYGHRNPVALNALHVCAQSICERVAHAYRSDEELSAELTRFATDGMKAYELLLEGLELRGDRQMVDVVAETLKMRLLLLTAAERQSIRDVAEMVSSMGATPLRVTTHRLDIERNAGVWEMKSRSQVHHWVANMVAQWRGEEIVRICATEAEKKFGRHARRWVDEHVRTADDALKGQYVDNAKFITSIGQLIQLFAGFGLEKVIFPDFFPAADPHAQAKDTTVHTPYMTCPMRYVQDRFVSS